MNIDICVKYWKIWKLYCFFNIPCICIFWYKIEELRALFSPTITNSVLFTFKIPPPESWIHQEDKCGFISEKSWDFEDWFSLWLILWETDTDSFSASTSQFSQATIKRLFFLFPPFCYRKTFSIFSQQKFCPITNTFYGGFRKLYFLCFFSSPDWMFSVCSLYLILLVRIDPITIIAFHVNTEIDQTRRAIVINMIWAYSQSRLCRLNLVNNLMWTVLIVLPLRENTIVWILSLWLKLIWLLCLFETFPYCAGELGELFRSASDETMK